MGSFRAWIWPSLLIVLAIGLTLFRLKDSERSVSSSDLSITQIKNIEVLQRHGEAIFLGEALKKLIEEEGTEKVLVSFWATWCPPCIKELPEFSHNRMKYRENGISVLLINFDKAFLQAGRDSVFDWLLENKIDLPNYFDTKEVLIEELNLSALPFNAIVKADLSVEWAGEGMINFEEFEKRFLGRREE